MDHTELLCLGTLLHSHSWQDSRDWARALSRLAELSDGEVDVVVGVVGRRDEPTQHRVRLPATAAFRNESG